jgi:hypothetical protein
MAERFQITNNTNGEQDYYLNENGFIVFTEAYHRKRGYCCGCGCKHCPFAYEAVKEPRRSELRAKREREEMTSASNDEYRKNSGV